MSGLLALGLLVFTGVGVGNLIVAPRPAHWPRTGWLALVGLMGLLCLATLANAIGVFGLPFVIVQAGAWAAATCGWASWLARPRAPCLVPRRAEGTILLLVSLLTFVPWAAAFAGLVHSHDTATIWYPKILEIINGVRPSPEQIAASWPTHGHAEYPRGLAWLAILGDPAGLASPALPQIVSLLITTAGALLLAGWFLAQRQLGWAALAVVLLLALPEVACEMALGMADLPLSIAILMTVMGLAWARGADPDVLARKSRSFGRLVAAVGGAAAASIKQEGAIIAAAVAVWATIGLLRGPRAERRQWLPCLAVLVTLAPWWMVRSQGQGEVLQNSWLISHPAFAVERAALLAEKLCLQMVDLARFDPHGPTDSRTPMAGWVLSGSLVVLLIFRRRPVPCWPVVALFIADLGIYSISYHDLTWHLRTSADRLWMQLSPALILAVLAAAHAASPREPADAIPAAPPPVPPAA